MQQNLFNKKLASHNEFKFYTDDQDITNLMQRKKTENKKIQIT